MKNALITGITGQDGSYLAELLLSKGYNVYGLYRRKSRLDYGNVSHIADKITLIEGDLTDQPSLVRAVAQSQPDEVYNLGAQSFVGTSFTQPVATAQVDGLGVVNLLDAIRIVKPAAKFYQASTSELFGGLSDAPYNEESPFRPRSPYGVAKLYAHWITRNFRESYGMFACCGILFNHESERRGKEFVTRKITSAVADIVNGRLDCLELGNLAAKRDWGHAEDYVNAMWLMLQQEEPDEFVIATGETHSVREFVKLAFGYAGIELEFRGEGINETAIDIRSGKTLIKVNPAFFRPAEVNVLLGDSSKSKQKLGWQPQVTFEALVKRMIEADLDSR